MTQPNPTEGQVPPAADGTVKTVEPLPAPKTEPLAGKVQAEKFGYASELLAYRVVDKLAETIAWKVDMAIDGRGHSVLLVGDLEYVVDALPLVEVQGQISLLKNAFKELKLRQERLLTGEEPEPEESVDSLAIETVAIATLLRVGWKFLPEISKAAGHVVDLLAYFRSDYTLAERDFDVAGAALVSSVAGNLVGKGFKPIIAGFKPAKTSQVISDITDLGHQAARLKNQRDVLQSRLSDSEQTSESEESQELAEIGAAVLDTDAALLSFMGFQASWTTPSAGQTGTKLEKALVREKVVGLDAPYILWLSTLSSGGEASARDRLFREDEIGFMGGAAVTYVLAKKDGEILAADTFAQYGVSGGPVANYVGQSTAVKYVPELPGGGASNSSPG